MVGLVGLERRAVLIADARNDPRYEWPEALELGGQRSMVGVPMLADDQAIGVIVLQRRSVDPFDERTIQLATTFAAQGSIAIQNVHLFHEMERRGGELARSVDELRALGEISQAVSSSLDLDEVLTTIVTPPCGCPAPKEDRSSSSTPHRALRHPRDVWHRRGAGRKGPPGSHSSRQTLLGRVAVRGGPGQAADLDHEPGDPHVNVLRRAGWRSMLVFHCSESTRSSAPLWFVVAPRGVLR